MSNESYVTSNTHLLQSAFTGSAFNVFGISPNLFLFLESIVEFVIVACSLLMSWGKNKSEKVMDPKSVCCAPW